MTTPPPPPMTLSGAATHTGRVRERNEDSVLVQHPVFAVADGMGGHAAGEVASALALSTLAGALATSGVTRDTLVAAVDAANHAILCRVQQQPETAGMGTTLTGVALAQVSGSPHWFVFNVGDSRVYHHAGGHLTQVSSDHSHVAELVRGGQLSPAEARAHPRRNVITRSLGSDPAPLVDIWTLPAVPGEILLACSDGLTLELSDEQIAEVLGRDEPSTAAARLVAAAVAAGGRDNVSAVVVELAAAHPTTDVEGSTAPRPRDPQVRP